MTGASLVVVHPRLGSLAVCVDRELAIHCGQSLRLAQRIPEATGCEGLAWHPRGPSLVAFVPGSTSAAVMLFTNGAATDASDCRQLRCAHTYQLPWARGLESAGVCLGEGHLLVGGADLCVWGCSFAPWPAGALPQEGVHLLDCAQEPELQQAMGDLGPVTGMSLDGSERFLATLHGNAESAVRVWWAASGEDDAHSIRPARRGVPGRCRLPRSTAQATSPIDGTCALLLSHGDPLVDVLWVPSAAGPGSLQLAVIATLTVGGTVTVWRESAHGTPLAFLVEALWHPGELWAGGPSCARAARCSLRWAAPGRRWSCDEGPEVAGSVDWGDRPGLPLQSSGHPAGVAEGPLSTGRPFGQAVEPTMLVLLRGDGQTASVHLQACSPGAESAVQPLAFQHTALPSLATVGGGEADAQCSSSLLHVNADADGAAATDALELLLSRGSDVYRVRLEDGERATVLAVAGELLGGESRAGRGPRSDERPGAAEPLAVMSVEIHRTLGFVACHLQGGAEEASTVWIGEVPCARASLTGGRRAMPQGAFRHGGLGSLQVAGGVRELCWAPGSVVPPVLLAVGRADGELLACAVDPVRGVVGPGAWAAVLRSAGGPAVRGVERLGSASEADGERAMLCLLSLPEDSPAAPELALARLSVPAGGGAPNLEVFFVHRPSAPLLSASGPRACFAVEWLGAPPQPAADGSAGLAPSQARGDCLLGQIAVCCAAEGADGSEAEDPRVYTLVAADQDVCARDALRAHVGPHGRALGLALHGEWLAAVVSSAEVLIWRLTSAAEAGAGCGPTVQVFQRIPLVTRKVHVGGALAARSHGDGRELAVGRAALHKFAGGGLSLLVSGSSDTDLALPVVIVRTRSAGEGETWRAMDLHADSLPMSALAVDWSPDGGVVHAGLTSTLASGVATAPRPALLASRLPDSALSWLASSAPCPAYHPDTLIWLLRSNNMRAAQHIMRSLLAVLSGARPMGIQPLLDVSLDELHATKASAGGPSADEPGPPAAAETKGATADSLFGGDDSEDEFEARLARLRRAFRDDSDDDEEDSPGREEVGGGPASQGQGPAAEKDAVWQLTAAEEEQLASALRATPLPLLSPQEQALLLILIQDVGLRNEASDLDECGQRFSRAFDVHRAMHRFHVDRSADGDPEMFLHHLSSEDVCWALHSDCQGTLVDAMLKLIGPELDWPVLRRAGLGLWLTDKSAMRTVLEALPRAIIRRQTAADDMQPEAVSLWYALLGKRTLLQALYRRATQVAGSQRVADFLGNDLGEEPWRTKAQKNAFELVRQRRFELACAFFVFSGAPHDAMGVCAQYLDDWPLALLIGRHLVGTGACPELAEHQQRLLLETLRPLAVKAGDPWLASVACWHAGERAEALGSVTPPYHGHRAQQAAGTQDAGGGAAALFSGGALQHSGASPGLPRFLEVLRAALAKRHLAEAEEAVHALIGDESNSDEVEAAVATAYVARRQPLLAVPSPTGCGHLPWRTAVAMGRALAALFFVGDQPLVRGDGSVVFDGLVPEVQARLRLPGAVVQTIFAEACLEASLQDPAAESLAVLVDAGPFYSPSSAPKPEVVAPNVQRCIDAGWNDAPDGSLAEEVDLCRSLRRHTATYVARALSANEHAVRVANLSAVVWRAMPCLRAYMLAPAQSRLPVLCMHLASHLVCACAVSRPPAAVFPREEQAVGLPGGSELPGDLAHIATALSVVAATCLSLNALAPGGGLWPGGGADDGGGEPPGDAATESDGQSHDEPCTPPGGGGAGPARPTAAEWDRALWQGLRVLFQHLEGGDAQEQRRLHRSGALPSLIASLFLQPTFLAGEAPGLPPLEVEEAAPGSPGSPGAPRQSADRRRPSPSPSPSPPLSSPSASDVEDEEGRQGTPACTPQEALQDLGWAASRDAPAAASLRALLHSTLAALAVERLLALLASIRKRPAGASSHWILVWYEALMTSLWAFLDGHVRQCVLRAASDVSANSARWPVALSAPEPQLSAFLGHLGGGPAFLALWQLLNGTCRLQILCAHHPALGLPAAQLPRRSAVLWNAGGGAPLRFVCSDRSVPWPRLAVHARGTTWEMHAGHAARWSGLAARGRSDEASSATAASADDPRRCYDSQVEPYLQCCLKVGLAGVLPSGAPTLDPSAELLLGRAGGRCGGGELSLGDGHFQGDDVARFLSTVRGPGPLGGGSAGRRSPHAAFAVRGAGLLSAAPHPSRPLYAVAAEDGSVHLWAFGEPGPRCALPRAADEVRPAAAGGAGAAPAPTAAPAADAGTAAPASESLDQKRCHLEWNAAGDRLLGVGSGTGVSLWAVCEGRAAPSVAVVPTDAARTKVATGAFVSAASVVATGGRRGDPDGGVSPSAAAGLCVWDTLAPPGASLVAHDAGADAASAMPPEYTCLAWAAGQRSILCGTKAGELRVFDLRQQRVSHKIAAHKAAVRYCFVLESSGRLATLSTMSELKIWNLKDMECVESWKQLHSSKGMGMGGVLGKSHVLTCATLLSDWHLVTGGQDGSLLLTRV